MQVLPIGDVDLTAIDDPVVAISLGSRPCPLYYYEELEDDSYVIRYRQAWKEATADKKGECKSERDLK